MRNTEFSASRQELVGPILELPQQGALVSGEVLITEPHLDLGVEFLQAQAGTPRIVTREVNNYRLNKEYKYMAGGNLFFRPFFSQKSVLTVLLYI